MSIYDDVKNRNGIRVAFLQELDQQGTTHDRQTWGQLIPVDTQKPSWERKKIKGSE